MSNKRGYKVDPVILKPHEFITRTYDETLHKQQIIVEEGTLWVYEEDQVIEKIPRSKTYRVKIGTPNKLGGGPNGVSFSEIYPK
jgi:hypothetical protein